jgi:hypothetical protein
LAGSEYLPHKAMPRKEINHMNVKFCSTVVLWGMPCLSFWHRKIQTCTSNQIASKILPEMQIYCQTWCALNSLMHSWSRSKGKMSRNVLVLNFSNLIHSYLHFCPYIAKIQGPMSQQMLKCCDYVVLSCGSEATFNCLISFFLSITLQD